MSTLTVHILKNTSSCHKGLTGCFWKEDFGNSSHYSQHTRSPSHLDTEVGWELSQVSLLGNLTVLSVADVDRGHGILGDKKLKFQRSLGKLNFKSGSFASPHNMDLNYFSMCRSSSWWNNNLKTKRTSRPTSESSSKELNLGCKLNQTWTRPDLDLT